MTVRALLVIDIHGYWHAGAGRSSGHHLDALCERDEEGLPILPGRQLKGLLRHAVRRAETWGWFEAFGLPPGPAASHEEILFGSASQQETRDGTHPGLLLTGSAQLQQEDRHWLASQPTTMREALFGELFSTAINELGSARAHSLRGSEVALPCCLHAWVEALPTALAVDRRRQQDDYIREGLPWKSLQAALPLLDHVGAHRSRGLGESSVRLDVSANGTGA